MLDPHACQLAREVEEFLIGMGIPASEQAPEYQIEIAYRMGYEDALRNYAIWKDGAQYVGAMRVPLNEVIAESRNQEVPIRY